MEARGPGMGEGALFGVVAPPASRRGSTRWRVCWRCCDICVLVVS